MDRPYRYTYCLNCEFRKFDGSCGIGKTQNTTYCEYYGHYDRAEYCDEEEGDYEDECIED